MCIRDRLCAEFSTKEISVVTQQSIPTIYQRKTNIRKKLGTCYERYEGILKDLTIMSDVFMRNVYKRIQN